MFCFVFEGNFQVQAPRGAYIWRGDLTEGFLRYEYGGLMFGRAYTWRGLFSEFYGILQRLCRQISLDYYTIPPATQAINQNVMGDMTVGGKFPFYNYLKQDKLNSKEYIHNIGK